MAIVTSRQYRPQTNTTSGANDPLSVAAVNELAWAVNNAKAYAMCHKTRGVIFFPALESPDGGTTSETVKMVFAPVNVPDGYRTFTWYLGAERFVGSGSAKTRWTLYSATQLYRGPDVLDPLHLGAGYQSEYVDVAADAHDIYMGTRLATPFHSFSTAPNAAGGHRLHYFVLTATNDAGCQTRVDTLDMIPRL